MVRLALAAHPPVLPFEAPKHTSATASVSFCSKLFGLSVCLILLTVVAWPKLRTDDPPARRTRPQAAHVAPLPEDPHPRPNLVDATAVVVTPDGKPAVKAQVALVAIGHTVQICDGQIVEKGTPCARTDAAGRFHFASAEWQFWLIVVHPSGQAHVQCTPVAAPKNVRLAAWAQVEGTYLIARKPKPGVGIDLHSYEFLNIGPHGVWLIDSNRQMTNANGRFGFERVMPGEGSVGKPWQRNLDDPMEMTSACVRKMHFLSAKTTRVEFGTAGRPVIGRTRASGEQGRNSLERRLRLRPPPWPTPRGRTDLLRHGCEERGVLHRRRARRQIHPLCTARRAPARS